jgi:hypothetical protein
VKLPTSLEETVQLPAVPAAEPDAEPVIDQPAQGVLPSQPGAHRRAAPLGKRKQVVLGAGAAFVVLAMGGGVLFGGSGGKSDEPASGQPAPAVVAPPPTSSPAEPTPSAAAGTLAVPTKKPVASAEVRAEPKAPATTSSSASKETETSESVDPRAAAFSSYMREFEDKYGQPPHHRR